MNKKREVFNSCAIPTLLPCLSQLPLQQRECNHWQDEHIHRHAINKQAKFETNLCKQKDPIRKSRQIKSDFGEN